MKKWQIYLLRTLKVITFFSILLGIFFIVFVFINARKTNHALNNIDFLHAEEIFRNRSVRPSDGSILSPRCVHKRENIELSWENDYMSHLCQLDSTYIKNIEEIVSDEDFLVYVYGASSVVSSPYPTFAHTLEKLLNENSIKSVVLNFGVSGSDSSSIKYLIMDTIDELGEPDLVIIYSGHNDYTFFYHVFIPEYHLISDVLYNFLSSIFPKFSSNVNRDYFIGRTSGPILNFMQSIKVVSFNYEPFEKINNMIFGAYKNNMEEAINYLSEKNIDLIYLTVIGNVEAVPYGNINKTKKYYKKGMNSNDYEDKMKYLKKAMDSEMFSRHHRAHSDLNEYIRNIERENVHVLDLEKVLMNKNFSFNYNDFIDYLHFSSSAYDVIANLLFDKITKTIMKI